MPIFDNNGKKQKVQDAHVEKYMELYPDATTIMERDGKKYRVKAKDYNTFLGDTLEAPKMESAPQPAPQVEAEPQQGFFTGVKAQIADIAKQAMQKPRGGEKAADKREQSTSSLDAMPSESGLREENGYTFTADELGIAEGKGKVEAEPTSVTTATEEVAAPVKTGASAAVPGEKAWWQNAAKIMGKEEAKPQMYGPMTKELMEEQQMLVEGRSIPQADIEAALPQANASMLQKMHEGATMKGAFDRAYGAAKGVYYADEAERLTKGLLDEYSAERAKRLSQVEKDVENFNSARKWAADPYSTDAYSEVAYRSNAMKLRNADELGMMEEFAKDAKKRLLADENLKVKAEENAELLGMPVERYINEVAVPIMQERMYSEWLAPQEERAKRNYNGLAAAAEGSLIGTLLGATRTDTEKYLSQVGQEAWRKNASLLGRAAAGAGSMFLDLPAFGGIGALASVPAKAVGGQVFKQLAKNETKRLVARGVAEGAAQRYANYAVRNGLKNRILLNLSTAPLQSGLTFGMFDAGKAALNMSLNGEWDWKELGKSAVGGTLMGGALGATGAVGGGLTHGLTGATKAAAKVAEFGVENAVFTEGGRLIGKLHGQQPENGWLEDYVESGATLLMIKAPNIVKNVSAIKGDKEASEVFAFNRLEREQLGKYGEDLNAVLESLLPKSGRLYEDGLKINEGTFPEEYRRVMSDPDVPMTTKAKLMGIVEGKVMPAPRVVDAKIEGNKVMTYDPMGRLVEVKEYATEAKANAEYKKVANAAEIESIAVMEDMYMRIKGYEADDVTVREWLAKNPTVTAEDIANIIAKNSAGEKLTEGEQRILDSLRKARHEGLNDVRFLNDVLAELDVDPKDVMSGIEKPIEKRTEAENRAVKAYTDVLYQEIKAKVVEPFRRGEARRAEDVDTTVRLIESDRSVDETANDGMVYTTTTPSGEKIIITGGKVVLDNEGYIDVNQSEGLVAMFPDGSRKPIRPGDLREKVEVSNAEEIKAAKREEIVESAKVKNEIGEPMTEPTAGASQNGNLVPGAEIEVAFEGEIYKLRVDGRDERGDVVLSGEGASMALPESVVQDAMKQAETLQAESGTEGRRPEGLKAKVEGENRAAPVESTVPTAEEVADAQAFADAYAANTMDAYQNYLDKFPEGAYREGARRGIWALEGTSSVADIASITNAENVLQRAAANEVQPEVAPVVEDQIGDNTEKVVEPADEAAAVEQNIPVDEKGKKMWEQSTPEYIAEYIRVRKPEDVEAQMSVVSGMIEGLEKQKSKMDAMDAMDIDDKIAFWKKVGELIGGAKDVVDPISQLNAKHSSALTAFNSMLENIRREGNEQKAAIRYEGLENMVAELGKQLPEGYTIGVVDGKYTIVEAQSAETTPVVESAPVEEVETPQATNEMQEADLENAKKGEKGQKAVEPGEEENESTLSQTSDQVGDQVAEGGNAPGNGGVEETIENGGENAVPEWLNKVPDDGRNFFVYVKFAGENKYQAIDLGKGETVDRLVRATMLQKEQLQALVDKLPSVLLEDAEFQIRDAKGNIYYNSGKVAAENEVAKQEDKDVAAFDKQAEIAKEREQRAGVAPRPGHLAVAIGEGNEKAVEEWKAKFDSHLQKLNADDLPTIDVTIKGMQGRKKDIRKIKKDGYKDDSNYKAYDYIETVLKKRAAELKKVSATEQPKQENKPVESEPIKDEAPVTSETTEQAETGEVADAGPVNMETLQLNMSDEDFNALLNGGDKTAISEYLAEMDGLLRIGVGSPLDGQEALREEYRKAVEQYGKENIPAEVMDDLNSRMQPYSDLSRAIFDRKYALQDKLREIEANEAQANEQAEKEAKAEHKQTAFGGFLAGKTDLGASAAEKALNKKYNFDGKVMTVAEFVEEAVANGNAKLLTIEEPKYKGASRAAWNRMDARQQEADAKRVKESGTKTVYTVNDHDFGKTAYDYAKFLLDKKAEREKAAAKQKVKDAIEPFAKEKAAEQAPIKIEDVGEKIGGAKKDRFAEGMARIKAELEETDETLTDKLAKLPVSQVFNFDLEKLREGGISNEAISFIKIVKDYLPAKPRKTYKIRSWVNNTLALYKLCLEAGTNWDRVNTLLNGPQFTSSSLKEQFDAYMAIGGFDSGMNIGNATLRQLDNKSGRYDENGKFVTLAGKWYVRDAGKHGGIYDTKEEAVNALKAFAGDKAGVTSSGKKKEVKFAVYQRRQDKSIFIAVKGKSDIVIQDGFKSSKEAFDYIEANNAELQERYRALLDKTNADFEDNRPREGRDYRDGKDIPAEEFRTTFGFRGVEFGNWMTQEDRRKALNECYDALMDLAAVCKVSPQALSLGGTLGMAFGARGGGRFSAHYEPGKLVINLTKTKGAGSLAHEWFHALDNYFAKMGSEGLDVYATAGEGLFPEGVSSIGKRYYDRKSGQMLTEEEYNERMNSHEVRREMADAWKSLMETLKKSDYYKRSLAYAGLHNSNYWSRPTELGARAFSTWVENELSKQGASNDYLANNPRFLVSEATDEQSRFMPYPFDADATWMEEAFGNLFEVMQEKTTEDGKAVLYSIAEDAMLQDKGTEAFERATKVTMDAVERLKENGVKVVKATKKMADALIKGSAEGLTTDELHELRGVVARGLADAEVKIVRCGNNPFNTKQKTVDLKKEVLGYAEKNGIIGTMSNEETNGKGEIKISKKSINKFVDDSASDKSVDIDIHLSVLPQIREVIASSIETEVHPDYVKVGKDRSRENGYNKNVLMHRCYGAVNIDGKVYRVKITLKEDITNRYTKAYSYEVTNIELFEGTDERAVTTFSQQYNSISAAKLLHNIEKSYDEGVKLLEASKNVPDFMTVFHGSGAQFDRFDHSFMGSGEGAQAFGWGTYVTEVEGIGRAYATSASRGKKVDYEKTSDAIAEDLEYKIGLPSGTLLVEYDGKRLRLDIAKYDDAIAEKLSEYTGIPKTETDAIRYALGEDAAELIDEHLYIGQRNLYTVEIPDDNGSNYLYWKADNNQETIGKLNEAYRNMLLERGVPAEDISPYFEPFNKGLSGESIYKIFARELGGDKEASQFLNRQGFVGISYPANATTGGRADGAMNYVIFNENDAKITNRVEFLRTANGKVYGWAVNGTIYLMPDGINPNTPVHEYAHLWGADVEKNNPKLWNEVVEAMKLSPVWNEVANDANYSNIHGNDSRMASEVLARLSGRENYRRTMEETQREIEQAKTIEEKAEKISRWAKVKAALKNFWNWVQRNVFKRGERSNVKTAGKREQSTSLLDAMPSGSGLREAKAESDSASEVMPWEEFANSVIGDFYKGKNPNVKESMLEKMAAGENSAESRVNNISIDLSNGPVRGVDEPEWKFKARREKWRRWVESNTSVKIPMPEKPFLQEGEPIEVYEERMKEFNKALNRWKKDILSKDSEIEEMLNILYDGKIPEKNPTPEDEFTEQVFKRYMGDDGIRVDRKSMRGMIMDEIIERRRKIETNNFDDVVFINEVRKATTAEQRKAIPFIIEGTYNGEVSKELAVVVRRVKDWFENVYQALQAADAMHSSGKIKNYVTHIWDKNRTPKAVYENYINTRSKYTNRRSIDTYAEGIALGMVPKYDDICDIMLEYGHIANEAIANKDFTDFLHMLRVDGEPVLKDATIRDPMYVRTSSEALDGYKVHKYAKGIVENVLGTVRTENAPEWMQKLAHFYDVSGSLMKKINLSLSFFHHGALLETAVGAMNPAKAVSTVFKNLVWDCMRSGELPALSNPEATRNAVNHLVQLGATQDYMAKEVNRLTGRLKEVLKDFSDKHPNLVTKGVVKPAELLDFLNTGFDKVLWDYLHDGLKIYTFDKYAKEIEEYAKKKGIGDTEKDMLLNEAGQLVNDIYGGQFWELIDVSPAAVKWLRRLLLSPDWTISTIRQALAPLGFGTLYKDYEKNWAQRTFGTGLSASFRRKQGVKFWITALLTFGALMNGLNAWRRKEDVDGELEKAEERRKTDPEYKSPYELKYPDGMKWYDYTMYGNTIGHQTHLFGWRYNDEKEGYIRWGKQYRELPELFLGKDGFSFPGPMIDKMVGKANPALSAGLAFLGYAKDGWQSKWMKDKKGWEKELGRVMMMASAFMPYSIPTDEDKEFMLTDLMMPSSKGFSNNKAIRGFETAILSQDFDYVGAVYDACVMNKLDAEKLLQAAIARVEAQAKAEYVEGANTLNEAWDKYQEDLEINEKRAVRTKFNKLLQENAYKDFEKQEARDMVQSVIDGTYREEKLPEAYIASETAEDVRDAYKMDAIRLRLEKVVDDIPEDAVAYKQYYNDNKAKIDLYDETVAAKREINLIMEDIKITPQFTEQYMQEIRDIRREIIEMANNLTGNNE